MKFPVTTEGKIKLGIVGYGIAGCVGFAIWGGLFAVLNFAATFLIVAVNFIYLEALTRKVVQKNPGKGALVLIIGMLRYAIVSWRHFLKIPAFAGLTAVVFALVAYPFLDGGSQKDASGSLDSHNAD